MYFIQYIYIYIKDYVKYLSVQCLTYIPMYNYEIIYLHYIPRNTIYLTQQIVYNNTYIKYITFINNMLMETKLLDYIQIRK